MQVTVAAWIGSTNLGDELIFSALARRLTTMGATVTAVSVDPAGTRVTHGVEAASHVSADAARALRRADGVVMGGGGLLQDRTSDLNLPYHLSRLAVVPRATPVVGVGLGAGPLLTAPGRMLVRRAVGRFDALAVRDAHSADLLEQLGLPRPRVAADLALSLPSPDVDPADRLVVALRPWTGTRRRLPVQVRRQASPQWFVTTIARTLDAAAAATGLGVHFVALDRERDHPVHLEVAGHMTTPVSFARPDLSSVLAELASGRAVVAMRYHAAIGAVLGGRPVVGIGYDPKVTSLLGELGPGGHPLAWGTPAELASLPDHLGRVLGHEARVVEARDRLREREAVNAEVLEHLLDLAAR